ncbi:MAG: hypothetical protein IKH44_03250, partial [Bacteroidales bacterium]|nr:hypothetical protein [Bacteroidales bacterium]
FVWETEIEENLTTYETPILFHAVFAFWPCGNRIEPTRYHHSAVGHHRSGSVGDFDRFGSHVLPMVACHGTFHY